MTEPARPRLRVPLSVPISLPMSSIPRARPGSPRGCDQPWRAGRPCRRLSGPVRGQRRRSGAAILDHQFRCRLRTTAAGAGGGGVAVMRGPDLWDFDTLNTRLRADRVTLAYLPTGYWRQWLRRLPDDLPDLRLMTVGGEALSGDALAAWRQGPLGSVAFRNSYGPTEATITVTDHVPGDDEAAAAMVAIGRPWPGRPALVLDGAGNPVPLGGYGELCLGGDLLARGYLGRPGLTAERFVPDAFGAPGARLYRSGDLTRPQAGGVIGFLGRIDTQIKLRGFRIEPGEIEAALRSVAGVRDAVISLVDGAGDARRLVAHVAADADVVTADMLSQALAAGLPDYMQPSAIMVIPALPLLPNGKVDRRALVIPAVATGTGALPGNETEARLLGIWQAVLGRSDIGIHDSFFDLGGDRSSACKWWHGRGMRA
ncbi:AMP-binding protein [Tistrella bauzanensis]